MGFKKDDAPEEAEIIKEKPDPKVEEKVEEEKVEEQPKEKTTISIEELIMNHEQRIVQMEAKWFRLGGL